MGYRVSIMRAYDFLPESTEQSLEEHELVWAKTKRGPVMKWRCKSGMRKGRVVPAIIDCSKPIDIKARERMKLTRKNTQRAAARKSKKTKRVNPYSRLAKMLNKSRRR